MNILIACEESQSVCIAFREKGHEAYSCDVQECSGGHPEWHIKGDVCRILNGASDDYYRETGFYTQDDNWHPLPWKWDLIIAFPPCTYLTLSGNRWYNISKYGDKAIKRNNDREKAINFFLTIANARCDRIAIENPIGIMSTHYRKPNQIIQPWQFAISQEEHTKKSTCLWLKNLPLLKPKYYKEPEIEYFTWIDKNGKQKRQTTWYYSTRCLTHSQRAKEASKTFPGIAQAMAEQWG